MKYVIEQGRVISLEERPLSLMGDAALLILLFSWNKCHVIF